MSKRTKSVKSLTLLLVVCVIVGAFFYYKTGENPYILIQDSQRADRFLGSVSQDITSLNFSGLLQRNSTAAQVAQLSHGSWWQVYFTQPNTLNNPENIQNSIVAHLINKINAAQKSIHIASFEFNLTHVANALIAAKNRGVEVQWVTDDEHGLEADHEEDHGQFAMLEAEDIAIKDDSRSALMHNKFWIFDESSVWTGSTNITRNGIFRNNNNVIVIESAQLARIYENEFSEMWNDGQFGRRSSSTVEEQIAIVEDDTLSVLFAAEDDVAERLSEIISRAQSSIRFMAFSFTHDDMGDAMLGRWQSGIDVKGIFETTGSQTKYSELHRFYNAGIPARQDGNKGILHHKAIILDGERVITGSFNFSNNADKKNDENVLIIKNRDIAELYLQEFERRWQEAKEPNPAVMNKIVS